MLILHKCFIRVCYPHLYYFPDLPSQGQWTNDLRRPAQESHATPGPGEGDGHRSELFTSFLSASTCILAWVTAASLQELACLACSNSVFSCWAVLSRELTISSRYSQLRCSDISSPLTTVGETALVGVEGGTAKAGSDVRTRM